MIIAGGQIGSLFEGEFPETLCFVPDVCIDRAGDHVRVVEGAYLRSGWDVRNMRFNDAGEGQHLFPNMERPVVDLEGKSVQTFLGRIERVAVA